MTVKSADDSRDEPGDGFISNGDAVCWLERVCDECGAITDAGSRSSAATCWRCGVELGDPDE